MPYGGQVQKKLGEEPQAQIDGAMDVMDGSQTSFPNPYIYPKGNYDLPANAYNLTSQYEIPMACMPRPAQGNTTGVATAVGINSYRVLKVPDQLVMQYDILIGTGAEKRGLIMKVWESPTVKKQIGLGWVFDGNKLGWCQREIGQKIFNVNLDTDYGIKPREGHPNTVKFQIRPTKKLNLAVLESYMTGQSAFDNHVLEAIGFIDHLMRETPSKTMIAIKRSYFHQQMVQRESIGGGVEAMKGVYQSIRAAEGGKLVVNVDVSNSCFWLLGGQLSVIAIQLTGVSRGEDLINRIKPAAIRFGGNIRDTKVMVNLRKLRRVRFRVSYKNMSKEQSQKTFVLADWLTTNCYDTKFDYKDKDTQEVKTMNLVDYFKMKYDFNLLQPYLPVIQTGKKNVMFPPEICFMDKGQRYPHKLDDVQVTKMIKFAVTRPNVRRQGIEGGIKLLDWGNDMYLNKYGLQINAKMIETNARLLRPPEVEYAGKQIEKPGTSGRWRVDGKKFLTPNPKVLESWGVCYMNTIGRDKIQPSQVDDFIRVFIEIYKGHGGRVTTRPVTIQGVANAAESVTGLYEQTKTQFKGLEPQLMIFMMSAKDIDTYRRIKKSADCRYGVVSQCMQNAHVIKKSHQYISNVLMKVNAKLGGSTAKVAGKNPTTGHFKVPTMIIGADVSHPGPGSLQPSMAALTVSMDRLGTRYAAAVETNGCRVEMVSTWNIDTMLEPLFKEWMSVVNGGKFPHHVMYFRDGVSEAQYQHVLQLEVRDLKHLWESIDTTPDKANFKKIKFTVVVASKRHHIRFFPKAGDKNGNPHPGTLVERDVTHPFEYDFYLNSHSAIQGTARPTHYHVLIDEAKMTASDLQNLIYEHCYQYARSTTPVSIFPAIYYAHLAALRAVAHERGPSDRKHSPDESLEKEKLMKAKLLSDATGKQMSERAIKRLKMLTCLEYPLLLPMLGSSRINYGMWYI